MKQILCLLIVIVSSCGDEPDVVPTAAPAPLSPRVVIAPPPLIGVLAAKDSNVVAAQIDGRIVHIDVTSGQRVHVGDPIAEIDAQVLLDRQRQARAAADAARADVSGAAAEVSEASRQLQLEQRLFAGGATSEESVRLARANLARTRAGEERAAATLREAEAGETTLEAELKHTNVTAPIDGIVSLVKAQAGEVVNPGAVIAHVFDPSKLTVRFQVTRDRRHDVDKGTTVALRVPGATQVVDARVTSISADLEPPLDFAVAEAEVIGDAHDVQIGTVGDVTIAKQ